MSQRTTLVSADWSAFCELVPDEGSDSPAARFLMATVIQLDPVLDDADVLAAGVRANAVT